MPLELGLFLGAKTFGLRGPRAKVCLILDRQKYRYQKFCSDIAGQDIESHDGKPQIAIKAVRDWLQTNRYGSPVTIPDGKTIYDRYRRQSTVLFRFPMRRSRFRKRARLFLPVFGSSFQVVLLLLQG
jgi:hypothetical protein